eukprot:GHVT01032814.1.p3 GENE.GHVT01032814.1~~GHVT01032814.1.p3  ORF type:complete len:111 (-),score=7.38 GHVT01032814.1:1000-1332(-)
MLHILGLARLNKSRQNEIEENGEDSTQNLRPTVFPPIDRHLSIAPTRRLLTHATKLVGSLQIRSTLPKTPYCMVAVYVRSSGRIVIMLVKRNTLLAVCQFVDDVGGPNTG